MEQLTPTNESALIKQIEELVMIDGQEYSTITESGPAAAIKTILEGIMEEAGKEEQEALDRARKERDESELMIGKLQDELAIAKKKIKQHQDTVVYYVKDVYGHWNDIRHTFNRFMTLFFDAQTQAQVRFSFFGKQIIPPSFEGIRVGPNPEDVLQVPAQMHWQLPLAKRYTIEDDPDWGTFNTETVEVFYNADTIEGKIKVTTTKNRRFFWEQLLAHYVVFHKENSLFRGRIVATSSNDGFEFIPTDGVTWDDVVLHPDTQESVDNFLRAPIRYRERLAKLGQSMRRGVLLAGKYGTGKTMLAKATATECEPNGVTFIMVRPEHLEQLPRVLEIARHYEPCVVFCEDIDKIVTNNRTHEADAILNTLDGVQKIGEVMVIFTTNHIENISQALQRPGRCDEIIHIGPADAENRVRHVKKVITDHNNNYNPDEFDNQRIADATQDFPGSYIVEAVKRATYAASIRAAKDNIEIGDEGLTISTEDFEWACKLLQGRVAQYKNYDPSQIPESPLGGAIPLPPGLLGAMLLGGSKKGNLF